MRRSEKRIDKRVQIGNAFEAELHIPDRIIVRNMSRSGICMRTPKRLSKNSVYKITICHDELSNVLPKGIVVWSTLIEGSSGEQTSAPGYESGLRFIGQTGKDKKYLERLLTKLDL